MTRPLVQIGLLALASIIGIAGMLLVNSAWDWLFLALAALPLLLGGIQFSLHQIRNGRSQ